MYASRVARGGVSGGNCMAGGVGWVTHCLFQLPGFTTTHTMHTNLTQMALRSKSYCINSIRDCGEGSEGNCHCSFGVFVPFFFLPSSLPLFTRSLFRRQTVSSINRVSWWWVADVTNTGAPSVYPLLSFASYWSKRDWKTERERMVLNLRGFISCMVSERERVCVCTHMVQWSFWKTGALFALFHTVEPHHHHRLSLSVYTLPTLTFPHLRLWLGHPWGWEKGSLPFFFFHFKGGPALLSKSNRPP